MGGPRNHPFIAGIFPYKPSSYGGAPMTMKTPCENLGHDLTWTRRFDALQIHSTRALHPYTQGSHASYNCLSTSHEVDICCRGRQCIHRNKEKCKEKQQKHERLQYVAGDLFRQHRKGIQDDVRHQLSHQCVETLNKLRLRDAAIPGEVHHIEKDPQLTVIHSEAHVLQDHICECIVANASFGHTTEGRWGLQTRVTGCDGSSFASTGILPLIGDNLHSTAARCKTPLSILSLISLSCAKSVTKCLFSAATS